MRTMPAAANLLIRFLAVEEGLLYLKQLDWTRAALKMWREVMHIDYVSLVEASLRRGLLRDTTADWGNGVGNGGGEEGEEGEFQRQPVPIPVRVPRNDTAGRAHTHTSLRQDTGFDFDDEESHSHPEHWSLEWLFRLPWRVKLYARTALGASTPVLLDTFVDASQVRATVAPCWAACSSFAPFSRSSHLPHSVHCLVALAAFVACFNLCATAAAGATCC